MTRLTMAQALVRYLAAQKTDIDGRLEPLFAGCWAIFGHGNVAGLGEALYQFKDVFPTYRAHNEQAMAHAAIAFAKAKFRRNIMACTTSIGPGATNLVTASALAHVNRLPVLFLPGDVFASRRPDPVLQQIETPHDPTITANDCLRPASRFFDRITRPEQIIVSLPQCLSMLTDPATCGPATLALCQDVQAQSYDYPDRFFEPRVWGGRRPKPDAHEFDRLVEFVCKAERPLIIAGGGVLYSNASHILSVFAEAMRIPVAHTQAGKSSLPEAHPFNLGGIGVTGAAAANAAAREADLIIGIGARMQDFTTASRSLFQNRDRKLVQVNVSASDAGKHGAYAVVGDAKTVLDDLFERLSDYQAPDEWGSINKARISNWKFATQKAIVVEAGKKPSDADVLRVVNAAAGEGATIVGAAGGLPGELHKLWRAGAPGSYHVEYGYSCMGYEIAGGLGVKMARPEADVIVMVGDGSYLMMNSEIATSVMLGLKLTLVILDNRGFGCINRLQNERAGASFNNLLKDTQHKELPEIDFVAHAASLGAEAEKVATLNDLAPAMARAKSSSKTYAIVIETDPHATTEEGGAWWDVAVAEVSEQPAVKAALKDYDSQRQKQIIDS